MRKASLATMSPIQKMKVLVDHYSTFKGRMNIILTFRLEGVGSKRVSCFRLSLGKQNDLNQVVVSSGFIENKGLGWVLNPAGS